MLTKLIKWLFGEKVGSSLGGVVIGAATGAATVAATGNLSKEALIVGAAGGAVSALAGAGGRATGEPTASTQTING